MKPVFKNYFFIFLIVIMIAIVTLSAFKKTSLQKNFEQDPSADGAYIADSVDGGGDADPADTNPDEYDEAIFEGLHHPGHDPVPIEEFIGNYEGLIAIGQFRITELSEFDFTGKEGLKPIVDKKKEKIMNGIAFLEKIRDNPAMVDLDGDSKVSDFERGMLEPDLSNSVFDIRSEIYLGDDPEILEHIYNGETVFEVDAGESALSFSPITGNAVRIVNREDFGQENKQDDECFGRNYVEIIIEGGLLEDKGFMQILDNYINAEERRGKYCLYPYAWNDVFADSLEDKAIRLRTHLVQEWNNDKEHFKGALFIGNIPYYVFYHRNKNDPAETYGTKVSDLFFMDLDGKMRTKEIGHDCHFIHICSIYSTPEECNSKYVKSEAGEENACIWDDAKERCRDSVDCAELSPDLCIDQQTCMLKPIMVSTHEKGTDDFTGTVTGDIYAEIFVSRFYPPVEDEKVEMLKHLLSKIIDAKEGKTFLNHNAVWFKYSYNTPSLSIGIEDSITSIYPDFSSAFRSDSQYPLKNTYDLNFFRGMYQNNELAVMEIHSTAKFLFFDEEDVLQVPSMVLNNDDIKILNPYFYFVLSGSCSVADITQPNYIGGQFLFHDSDYVITFFGNSGGGYLYDIDVFLIFLSQKQDFGTAYMTWMNHRLLQVEGAGQIEKRYYDYGRMLMGDPFLTLNELQPSPEYFNYIYNSGDNLLKYKCGLCLSERNNIYKIFEDGDLCKSMLITNNEDEKIYLDSKMNPFVCIDDKWKNAGCWATASSRKNDLSVVIYRLGDKSYPLPPDIYTRPFIITTPDISYPDIETGKSFICKEQSWSKKSEIKLLLDLLQSLFSP
ncbi:MAG: hypothetical protein KKF44_00040 [Nanoarchaeota archaeon]|nr:hypothetical protein [Nanoarchaeota archaeon]